MYKNQLQELAQRSCFNLPSYTCVREGPDHAPRFKATVNFNGEIFESPGFCTTLRQAEHSAAEVALTSLSTRGPSLSLAAKILDETGVHKNLLQEVAQRVGAPLPAYTTFRSGLGHLPVFTCEVELAGFKFTGEPAKNKKQAEKNAAMAAWLSLKELVHLLAGSSSQIQTTDEQEHVIVARALLKYREEEKFAALTGNKTHRFPFPRKSLIHDQKPSISKPLAATCSKILPLIRPQTTPRNRSSNAMKSIVGATNGRSLSSPALPQSTAGATVRVTNRRTSTSSLPLVVSNSESLSPFSAQPAVGVTNSRPSSSLTSVSAFTTSTTMLTNAQSPSPSTTTASSTVTTMNSHIHSSLPSLPPTISSGVACPQSSSSSLNPSNAPPRALTNFRFSSLSSCPATSVPKATSGFSLSPSLSSDNHCSSLENLDNVSFSMKMRGDQLSSLHKFSAVGAAPYVPVRQYRVPCHGIAPPVTVRTAVPVYSSPPLPAPSARPHLNALPLQIAPAVHARPMLPVFESPSAQMDGSPIFSCSPLVNQMEERKISPHLSMLNRLPTQAEETGSAATNSVQESVAVQSIKRLNI